VDVRNPKNDQVEFGRIGLPVLEARLTALIPLFVPLT
jgi:hypothetical protein